MQILKETSNGDRIRVSDWDHAKDKMTNGYRVIVSTRNLCIYAMQPPKIHFEPPLVYGGRKIRNGNHRMGC
jgi:hypothetical protein